MSRVWSKYEIVQYVPQTPPIVLVGETHDAEQSRKIVSDVIDAEDWGAICVELCSARVERDEEGQLSPKTTHSNHGFSTAFEYAHEKNIPVGLVDIPEALSRVRVEAALKANSGGVVSLEDISSSVSVAESGDIPLQDVEEYLETLRNEYPDVYDVIHGERDITLAKHITRVHRWADGPVLAVVGAAHVIPLVEELWQPRKDTQTGNSVTIHTEDGVIQLADEYGSESS